MNIILDAPLPISQISRKEYDNKILYIFLTLIIFLMAVGFVFVDLTKTTSVSPSIEKPIFSEQSEYV